MGWDAATYRQHAAFVPALGAAALVLLAPVPGERILDRGCGDGALAARIAAAGAEVLGLAPVLTDETGRWMADDVRLRWQARKPGDA